MKPWEYLNPDGKTVPCAWCQQEQGVAPQPGESHGICQKHFLEELAKLPGPSVAAPAAFLARHRVEAS